MCFFFFSSRRRHTRLQGDWSSDVCSSDLADGSGTNVVRYEVPVSAFAAKNVTIAATLYYQSIPPYFLRDRFSQAPNSPATQRLYYLTSNLQTKGTPIENWKFQITTASQAATLR